MIIFQYHLIGHCNDTACVKKEVLKASTEFAGFLTTKISWSKNVAKQHDCPNQLMIPSIDSTICVYLHLALWLEWWIQYRDGSLSQWLFVDGTTMRGSSIDDQDKEAVLAVKKLYSLAASKATKGNSFTQCQEAGNLVSHSTRKLAAREDRKWGVPKDDVDYRAW